MFNFRGKISLRCFQPFLLHLLLLCTVSNSAASCERARLQRADTAAWHNNRTTDWPDKEDISNKTSQRQNRYFCQCRLTHFPWISYRRGKMGRQRDPQLHAVPALVGFRCCLFFVFAFRFGHGRKGACYTYLYVSLSDLHLCFCTTERF